MEFIKQKWSAAMIVTLLSVLWSSCDKQPIGPTGPDPVGPAAPGQYISLKDFRALYPGSGNFTIPAGTKKFRAVVISNSANEAAGNFRLQDESGSGIRLYAAIGSPVYSLGSVLEVDPTGGGILELYNGDLELKSVPQAKVVPLSGTITVTTRNATIADIITNKDLWASSLVKVTGVTITQGSTNGTGTNYTLTDASGTITMFVRTASGITVTTGSNKTVTGYITIYQSAAELVIRSAADIQ
ncbi:MAG: hypothetical protein HOP10_06985 [Chitinophagaceae bacterium]|nr:hypothetical protein [Chitinophagaceae bacterium]